MPKVYIVNNMNHNFSIAEEYGELKDVTVGKVPIFKDDAVIHVLKESLKDFNQEDYLLLTGPVTVNIYAVSILAKRYDSFKMLVFDAKNQGYEVRHYNKIKFE